MILSAIFRLKHVVRNPERRISSVCGWKANLKSRKILAMHCQQFLYQQRSILSTLLYEVWYFLPFYHTTRMHSAIFAMAWCLSVCLYVCYKPVLSRFFCLFCHDTSDVARVVYLVQPTTVANSSDWSSTFVYNTMGTGRVGSFICDSRDLSFRSVCVCVCVCVSAKLQVIILSKNWSLLPLCCTLSLESAPFVSSSTSFRCQFFHFLLTYSFNHHFFLFWFTTLYIYHSLCLSFLA